MEYATDLVFRSAGTLGPLYEQLVRQSVLDVKAEHVALFLGRQITPLLTQESGSQFATRIEGTCIKHRFGSCSIKMYDKHGIVLRIETTANDVSFFNHHRKVQHRQGPPTREVAPVKETIYSLIDLREILLGCNRRYLANLSALDDFSSGVRSLARLTKSRQHRGRTVKGSTSSPLTRGPCCMRSGTRKATSPGSAVAIRCPCYRYSRRRGCRGNCANCRFALRACKIVGSPEATGLATSFFRRQSLSLADIRLSRRWPSSQAIPPAPHDFACSLYSQQAKLCHWC